MRVRCPHETDSATPPDAPCFFSLACWGLDIRRLRINLFCKTILLSHPHPKNSRNARSSSPKNWALKTRFGWKTKSPTSLPPKNARRILSYPRMRSASSLEKVSGSAAIPTPNHRSTQPKRNTTADSPMLTNTFLLAFPAGKRTAAGPTSFGVRWTRLTRIQRVARTNVLQTKVAVNPRPIRGKPGVIAIWKVLARTSKSSLWILRGRASITLPTILARKMPSLTFRARG